MTKRYHKTSRFTPLKRRKVDVNFEGGDVTADGGVLLLREIDRKLKLTESISKAIKDTRHQSYCVHTQLTLVRQRIFGLALGYEDLNDHTTLRHDPALQTASGELTLLGSASTLCRMEQRADMSAAIKLHEVLVDQFIASFDAPPKRLTLDFDATHDLVYGDQEKRYFNAFYDDYCFLPLYVFCGKQLLVSYLRPSSRGAAHKAGAVLKLLVKRLRQEWPKVTIVFRGDAGFCKPLLLHWCDRNKVEFIIGLGKNSVLTEQSEVIRSVSETLYGLENKRQKHYSEFFYKARKWAKEQRVIVKAEYNERGENTRYVVTSLRQSAKHLYEKEYCIRGDMENRIKEQKLLFSDRTSCHRWWPNQLRLLLSGFAYVLLDALRRVALVDTEFANSQVDTLRIKLLKIGGVVIRNTRRIKIMLTNGYPHQEIFNVVAKTLNSS